MRQGAKGWGVDYILFEGVRLTVFRYYRQLAARPEEPGLWSVDDGRLSEDSGDPLTCRGLLVVLTIPRGSAEFSGRPELSSAVMRP